MTEHRARELAGVAAAGVGVCCGVPLLFGAGAFGAAAGIALGSALIAAIGAAAGAVGLMRWRRRRAGAFRAGPSRNSGGC